MAAAGRLLCVGVACCHDESTLRRQGIRETAAAASRRNSASAIFSPQRAHNSAVASASAPRQHSRHRRAAAIAAGPPASRRGGLAPARALSSSASASPEPASASGSGGGDFSLAAALKLIPGTAVTVLVASAVLLLVSAIPSPSLRACGCLLGGAALALRGYSKRSLSVRGAAAALTVGALCEWAGAAFAVVLIAFFFTSSRLTQFGAERKASIEADYKAGGQRGAGQVFANAGVPTALALLAASPSLCAALPLPLPFALDPARLGGAFLAYFACCCGDTWASELGVLARGKPRLITTLREVAPGTNGGVSALGTAASAAGGALMGLCFLAARRAADLPCSDAAPALGALWGIAGSMLDSLLGATVQFSGVHQATGKSVNRPGPTVRKTSGLDLLTNSAVNFWSAAAVAAVGGAAGPPLW